MVGKCIINEVLRQLISESQLDIIPGQDGRGSLCQAGWQTNDLPHEFQPGKEEGEI